MTAPAPERSLSDLVLHPGMDVVTFGTLDLSGPSGAVTVWSLRPWEPTRPQRHVGGDVKVVAESLPYDVPDGAVVRVRGTWTGSHIDSAIVEISTEPVAVRVASSADRLSLRDAGLDRYLELTGAVAATPAPVIGSGGGSPGDAAWFHVLYATPELAAVIEQTPLRAWVQISITPLQ